MIARPDRAPQSDLGPATTGPTASCRGRGRTWHGAGMGGERRRTKRCNLTPRPRVYRRRWPPPRPLPPPRSPPRLDRSHEPLSVWLLWFRAYGVTRWEPGFRPRPDGVHRGRWPASPFFVSSWRRIAEPRFVAALPNGALPDRQGVLGYVRDFPARRQEGHEEARLRPNHRWIWSQTDGDRALPTDNAIRAYGFDRW